MSYRFFTALVVVFVLALSSPVLALADVSGDPVEIGVEWGGDYSLSPDEYLANHPLYTADDCVLGLKDIYYDGATNWVWDYEAGNSSVWETDWTPPRLGGHSDDWADDVDLVAFCGHGYGNRFEFNNAHDEYFVRPTSMDLGVHDCEWMLTFTCNFLANTWSSFGTAANGVHLICGYATDMTVTANGGDRFAYYAMHPYSVRVAWYKYGQVTQLAANENTARTFGADASYNDYLWRYGTVSADPASAFGDDSSIYSYWDTKLNW